MLLETLAGAAPAAALLAWAVRGRSSGLFCPVVWRGAPDRRSVALTFDDGPSESTPLLVELLDGLGIRATFFLTGLAAERLPGVTRSIAAAGHEIASHGHSHAPLYLRSPGFILEEIRRAQDAIEQTSGVVPKLYRPAYGCRWFGLRAALERFGLTLVMWTAIGRDWKHPAGRVAGRLLKAASNGAIFCLHDGRLLAPKPDIGATLEAVRLLVPRLQDRGYRFETAGELIRNATGR